MSPSADRRRDSYANAVLAELRHGLRTPFREILQTAEILIEEASTLHNERALDLLRHIHSAGLGALADVNQALSNRDSVEPGEVEVLSAKICPRVERILLSAEGLARDSGVAPEDWTEDIEKITDTARVLMRLAGNAQAEWPEEAVDASEPAPGPGAARLLLAGGEATERRVLCRRLQRQGFSGMEAADGSVALDAIAAERFDLVLLDLLMPGMSAFELIERIKADPRLRAVPILVIAPLDESERVLRALQIGADDYVLKPFDPGLLSQRINLHLELRRLRERASALENSGGQEPVGSVRRIVELASFLVHEHCRRAGDLGMDGTGLEQLEEIAVRLDETAGRLRQ